MPAERKCRKSKAGGATLLGGSPLQPLGGAPLQPPLGEDIKTETGVVGGSPLEDIKTETGVVGGPPLEDIKTETGVVGGDPLIEEPELGVVGGDPLGGVPPKLPKKRGRKPKGGKIIQNNFSQEINKTPEPNIIMHLKCGEADLTQNTFISSLTYEPNVPPVETFQFEHSNELGYSVIDYGAKDYNGKPVKEYNEIQAEPKAPVILNENDEMRQIWGKLKELTYQLHTNSISDKKSACFWCTCDFDNPTILIPKFELNKMYHCYGCFCSPECATAYLFEEAVDTSTRFERYHLLNHIYSKIYNYEKNIKPAPNPYYTLNKYYGNLTIQEYRKLLQNERLLLVVDKPLSRILPELHEDNDDYMFNGTTISTSNKFKLRRKTKQTKTDILTDTFNLK
jgi:hypothetical protein